MPALFALACTTVAGQDDGDQIGPIWIDGGTEEDALEKLAAILGRVNDMDLGPALSDAGGPYIAAPNEIAAAMLHTWPEHGVVTMSAVDGSEFTYTPEAGYVGADLFSYDTTFADGSVYTTVVNIVVPPAEVVE